VAITLDLFRNGAVGFIGWLDDWRAMLMSSEEIAATNAWRSKKLRENI